MTITNGYVTLAEALAEIGGTNNTSSDARLEQAVEAASRQIDDYTGRKFWQDPTVTTRTYYPDDAYELHSAPGAVLDISTTTGLVVKIDEGDDGTFNTTLTINTDFIVQPTNASADGMPFTSLRIVGGSYSLPRWGSGRPGVSVTAKFGFASVPEPVKQACLVQAVLLYKATDAAMGGLSFGDGAFMRVRGGLNPIAQSLVDRYSFARVA